MQAELTRPAASSVAEDEQTGEGDLLETQDY